MPLLIVALYLAVSFASGQISTPPNDLRALYSLRSSLSVHTADWPRGADPCFSWTGVTCNSAGRVISINLHGLRRTRFGRSLFSVEGVQNLTFLASFNATGFSLPGQIPAWFGLSNPNLALIDLSHASVSGAIPSSLGNIASLVSLNLSSNFLTGPLPDSLQKLNRLKSLNFGNNSLSGSVKGEVFSGLSNLESVTLSRNRFSGLIPRPVLSLPALKFLDVSYNNFTRVILPDVAAANFSRDDIEYDFSHNLLYGSISSKFTVLFFRSNSINISYNYFQGSDPFDGGGRNNLPAVSNCFPNTSSQRSKVECERFYQERGIHYDGVVNLTASPAPTPNFNSSDKSKKKSRIYILIGTIFGAAIIVFLVILIVVCLMRRRRAHSAEQESNVSLVANSPLPATKDGFTYEQLVIATSNFSDDNLIKHGHSGDLFHGVLEDLSRVVVKRIDMVYAAHKAYSVELDLLRRSPHERLVGLLGHCLQRENEKFLVYKLMNNRDLCYGLYGMEEDGFQPLDWITRLKIATGVAEALCYLHHEFTPPLVHRDVQASSILLDDNFEVRLGSLSNVCPQKREGYKTVLSSYLSLRQRFERRASDLGPASCAYDVYCFGKVLIELITGKLGISASKSESATEWLEHTLGHIDIKDRGPISKIMDPSLIGYDDLLEEVWAVSIVARSCLNPKPANRPLAKDVREALQNPLRVVREDNNASASEGLRGSFSSRRRWRAAFFGSWRHPSLPRSGDHLSPTDAWRSRASGGEPSPSHRRSLNEIVPAPNDFED